MDVQVVLEKQPNPKNVTDTSHRFFVRVEDSQKNVLKDEAVELEASRPVELAFRAEKAGVYTVTVLDPLKIPIATRPVEIRETNLEFQNTARNMETLRQWASVSDGFATKVEDCRDAADLVTQIRARIEQVRRSKQMRVPIAINGWTLALALGCLGGEWLLRKRWGLT